jgi:hypothetical protein
MLDPTTIGIGVAIWLAFRNQGNSQFGVLTAERDEVYRNALEFLHDPLKLEELANTYQKEGLKVQAAMLRKRAEWRGRSETLRAQHEDIFNRAMQSKNVHGILAVAEAFEKMTATAKAKELREHAKGLYEANAAEVRAKAEAEKAPKAEPESAPVQESTVVPKAKANGAKAESIPRNTDDGTQTEIVS